MIAGVWELVALSKFYQLQDCEFTIAYFNLIFYFGYMIHALLSWFILPVIGFYLWTRTARDVE